MSVADNIGLSLEMTGLSTLQRLPLIGPLMPGARAARQAVAARVNRAAELTEIAHLLTRRPAQLSGGQRQRVALARAMAREPGIFLMDEPLSNLDAKLRVAMRSEIVDLNKRLGATFLFVTHDQSDAMAMSDRIALILGGRIRQIGAPQEIYDAPVHIEVATFIGQPAINLLQVEIDASGRIGFAGSRQPFAVSALPAGHATLGIRAECFEPAAAIAPGGLFALAARLDRVERMGAETLLRCRTPGVEKPVICRLTTDRFDALTATGLFSHEFQLSARARGTHLFGPDGAAETFRPLVKVGLEAAQ